MPKFPRAYLCVLFDSWGFMFQILIISAGSESSWICLTPRRFSAGFVTWKQNNSRTPAAAFTRAWRTRRLFFYFFFAAHKIENLWESCAVNFMGARFVVPYFIKSNLGGFSCSPCACWAVRPLSGIRHLHSFRSTVACLSVCVFVCV